MPHSGVSEKMQRALRKLQHSILSANMHYHSLNHDATPKAGGSLRNGNSFGGSIKNGSAFGRSRRLGSSDLECDDSAPNDVPEGFLVVYVGQERRRFVINAKNLNHSMFRVLLDRSAEEFGYKHKGGLAIACEVVFFEHLLWLIETNDPSLSSMEIDELAGIYAYT